MNTWIKTNPLFLGDDSLDTFLSEAKGLLIMYDAPNRYNYQELPKYIIYTL